MSNGVNAINVVLMVVVIGLTCIYILLSTMWILLFVFNFSEQPLVGMDDENGWCL